MFSLVFMILSFGSYGAFTLTLMLSAAHAPAFTRTDQLFAALMMTVMLAMATAFSGLSHVLG